MGLLKDLKFRRDTLLRGEPQEYKKYIDQKKLLLDDIKRFEGYVKKFSQEFETIKFSLERGEPEPYKNAYTHALHELQRWQYELYKAKLAIDFIRPNSKEDIEYRDRIFSEFSKEVDEVVSPNLDLRFHGTPLYLAKEILLSGGISSSVDRHNGYMSSTDEAGIISVTTKSGIDRTIYFFSDLGSYARCMPSGAVFILVPKDEKDSEIGAQSLMHNVDFRKNPEQFYGVMSSPENIDSLKEWVRQVGLPEDKVYTFEQFLQIAKVHSSYVDHEKEFMSQFEDVGRSSSRAGQTQELTQDLRNNNQRNVDYDDGR